MSIKHQDYEKTQVYEGTLESEEYRGFLICNIKEKFLKALYFIEYIQKIMLSNNRVARIVLEESIAVYWVELKKTIKQIINIIPYLKTAVIWNIEDMQNLIIYFENNLTDLELSPCNFAIFLEELAKKKQTKYDIKFLKYILSDDIICKKVFRTSLFS
jgi:hypothetical protein